jgi:hypothetical protein
VVIITLNLEDYLLSKTRSDCFRFEGVSYGVNFKRKILEERLKNIRIPKMYSNKIVAFNPCSADAVIPV